MEEDDMDFTPTQGTSSNLASLFGFTKAPPQGNSSLIYTPPKAPKKDSTPVVPGKVKSEEKTVGRIICSKAVQAYKLENRSYVSQGLTGIVISGNHTTHIYELILYKPTKEVLTKTRITRGFSFTVAVNNYLSFYDNNKQNWSIMFQSPTDVQQFIEKLSISKFYSYPKSSECLLIQDLIPASQSQTQSDSTVEVVYSSFELEPEGTTVLIKNEIKEKVNLSADNIQPLNEGLVGCWENCKRLIIAPHSLSGLWISQLDKTKDLMLKVKIERITTETKCLEPRSNSTEEGVESPIESSAEEGSIKARGVSIKEALTSTKSQKANLISRMARMGQATLPLKQSLSGGPSDSEEEVPVTSSPKPRVSRGRGSSNNSHQSVPTLTQTPPNPETLKQISVYQNDLMWQQSQLGKVGMIHQQLVPVSASPISSPTTDPNLSVYVSESRIQAAEIRMGLSKVSEKLDLVWNKLQNANLSPPENKSHQSGLVDTAGILSSIQNLITENENLRGKVEEQKGKLDQQNDRIFQLLELNHKYLERDSTSHDKQSEYEIKLKTEMERLRKRENELEEDNKKYSERAVSLERDLEKAEKSNKELEGRIEELNGDLDRLRKCTEGNDSAMKKEMESYEERLVKASESMTVLKEKLKQVVAENEKLKSTIGVQREELEARKVEMEEEARRRKEEYERTVESLKGKLTERSESESRMEELEKENRSLLMRIEKEKKDKDEEVKKVLRQISTTLRERFSDSEDYSGSTVLSTLDKFFKDVVNGCPTAGSPMVKERKGGVNDSRTVFESSEDSIVLPKPRTSLMKPETSSKGDEGSESTVEPADETAVSTSIKTEDEKEKKSEGDNKENVDSRYKSYDQSWRTTKPPPPPLFDDDDDDDDWLN